MYKLSIWIWWCISMKIIITILLKDHCTYCNCISRYSPWLVTQFLWKCHNEHYLCHAWHRRQGLLYFRYVLRSPVLFLVVTLTLFINLSDMIVWLFDALKRFSDSDRIELHLTELISNATLPPRSVARSCHLITNSAKSVILWKINCNSCKVLWFFLFIGLL